MSNYYVVTTPPPKLEYVSAPRLIKISYDVYNKNGKLINVESDDRFDIHQTGICYLGKLSTELNNEILDMIKSAYQSNTKSANNL